MADKTVYFKNLSINATTIGDFFYRLNTLKKIGEIYGVREDVNENYLYNVGSYTDASGKTFFTTGLEDEKIKPFDIIDVSKAALNTKNAISFLSTVNISSYDVSSLAFNAAIASKTSVAKIEKAIGSLESACVTFKNSNKTSNFISNFSAVNKQGLTIFHSVDSSVCTNVGAGGGTSCPGNFTAVYGAVKTTNHAAVNFTFGHNTFDSNYTSTFNKTHKSNNFSPHGNVTNRSAGIQFNYTGFHMAQGGTKTAVHSSNNKENFGTFATCRKYCKNNDKTNYTTYHKSVARYSANFSPNAVASFSPNQNKYDAIVTNSGFSPTVYFTNVFRCSQHNQSVDTTFNATNRVGHNDTVIANISYHANHSVFRVEGVDF